MVWPPGVNVASRKTLTREHVVAAERVERADWRDAYCSVGPDLASAFGMRFERVGGSDLLILTAVDMLMFNRVSGLGVEIPATDDPAELVDAISQTHAKAKIRTGGVTTDAFPSTAHVARFIERCVAHGVAFKATAGLHHPWRSDYRLTYAHDAPRGTMFGFLNVLLATASARAGWSAADCNAVLGECEPGAARFDDRGALWHERQLSTAMLECARETMIALGSCTFREPLAELRSLSPPLL